VTNAVRYTPPGAAIDVELRVRGDDVVVVVSDNGSGVPAEERERIFEPFYRGRAQRGIPGDGLGLPISRRIARAHGGDLKLESAPGRGCAFHVSLPVVAAPPAGAESGGGAAAPRGAPGGG
jgi:signal transduction histidine kinase